MFIKFQLKSDIFSWVAIKVIDSFKTRYRLILFLIVFILFRSKNRKYSQVAYKITTSASNRQSVSMIKWSTAHSESIALFHDELWFLPFLLIRLINLRRLGRTFDCLSTPWWSCLSSLHFCRVSKLYLLVFLWEIYRWTFY